MAEVYSSYWMSVSVVYICNKKPIKKVILLLLLLNEWKTRRKARKKEISHTQTQYKLIGNENNKKHYKVKVDSQIEIYVLVFSIFNFCWSTVIVPMNASSPNSLYLLSAETKVNWNNNSNTQNYSKVILQNWHSSIYNTNKD